MEELNLHVASTFGLLLGVSLLAGLAAELIHIPKVTAYLLIGLVMGPSFLDLVPHKQVEAFEPMLKLAMALVLFNLGCQFSFKRLKRIARQCLVLSAGELLFTFGIVCLGLLAFRAPLDQSILLGCLALATAPATTVLVLKEFRSQGPVTESAGFLLAVNNLASIVAFELAFLAINLLQGNLEIPFSQGLLLLLRDILGSIAIGIVGGLAVSYSCGLMRQSRWLVLLVAVSTLIMGFCLTAGIPYLLVFLVLGVTLTNTSSLSDKIVDELNHLTGLLCVLFFAVHGAELDAQAFLAAGLIGFVYIVARVAGKCLGVYTAARATRQPLEVRYWLGPSLLAQAGAAIALSSIAVQRNPTLGKPIQDIILGSVVIFELIGPLMIRFSLIRAGEVPISNVIHHSSSTPWELIRDLWDRMRLSWRDDAETPNRQLPALELAPFVRKVEPLLESASFDEVLAHIEHSHDNTYPVVNRDNEIVGLIRYPLLSNVMFDPSVTQLVKAEDLATPADQLLLPSDTVVHASEVFQAEVDDCLPVLVPDTNRQLLGVVRRTDIMHALIVMRRKARA